MLISEFDLYKREWLSLVFKDRNQQYGAYELRNHYSDIMVRAMAATFLLVGLAAGAVTIISHNRPIVAPDPIYKVVPVTLPDNKVYEAPKPKELQKPKQQAAEAPAKATPVSTQQINYKVTPDNKVIEDPKPIDAKVAIGPTDVHVDGPSTLQNPGLGAENGTGKGDATPAAVDNGNGTLITAEVMPEPIGGEKAWQKFLQKNLHFPAVAQENGQSGKVYISFIVEKDGHLSDITVLRKAGFGFDEEALRVMKLAPAWKPGAQNNQAVRVRFTIPINFQLSEN